MLKSPVVVVKGPRLPIVLSSLVRFADPTEPEQDSDLRGGASGLGRAADRLQIKRGGANRRRGVDGNALIFQGRAGQWVMRKSKNENR